MIQLQEEHLTNEKYIDNVIAEAKQVLEKRKTLYNRYLKSDEQEIKVPLEYYITNIASGYFGGKAPKYSIKQEKNEKKKNIIKKLLDKIIGKNDNPEEFQILIDYIRDYNDDSSFYYDLVKNYIITGACYGLQYITDNNEIVYANASSLQCVAIYDYSTPVQKIGLIRIWQEKDKDGNENDMVEIITKDNKFYYKNSTLQPETYKEDPGERENVNWLLVPALAIENKDNLGFFEPVLTLIDAFEQIIKNNRNIFQYNDEAKLKITGYQPQNEPLIPDPNDSNKMVENPEYKKEIEMIRKMQIFFTPDKNGDIDWIIKNINDTASENHKKTLIELILMTVCVPNVTDVGFTNADNASALEKKFFPLEQVLIQADKQFKKELLAMWENIVDMINTKKSTNFDFRDINIELQRNMPTEKADMVKMALDLRGLLSDETVIGMLPYDLDVQSELAKVDEQNKENMIDNFNNMVSLSKDNSKKENQKEINQKSDDKNQEE